MGQFLMIAGMAAAAGIASLAGGVVAARRPPSTLFSSISLGLAGGALLGAISFEMLPRARELAGLPMATGGLVVGVLLLYGFEFAVMRGEVAGEAAEQWAATERYHHWRRPWGDEVSVLAGGTAAEELIEGVSIGVAGVIEPGLALLIAASITLDNLTEGMAIGALAVEEGAEAGGERAIKWSSMIGISLFGSAAASWLFLRSVPDTALGALVAIGAGGMLYLTVTGLIPKAEQRHYLHSSALALTVGFVAIFVLAAHV